jgi:hypothetical protein
MDIRTLATNAGILMLALTAFSCVSTSGLYNGFTKNKASLKYIYDSDFDNDTTNYTVTIKKPIIVDNKFRDVGIVRKTKSSLVPLILFYQWRSEYEYTIGKTAIRENIEDFIQSSFMEESKRSGTYTPDTTASPEQLTLEIAVDSVGARGPYFSEGYIVYLLFFYSYGVSEGAGPGVAFSRFHYQLKKGDEVLLDDFVSNRKYLQPIRKTHTSTKALRSFYTTSLVESLSATFKTNIEIIVEDIDLFLDLEKEKLGKL